MNITLVSLNSQYIHSSLAPYCLLSGIKEYGTPSWKASVVEGTVNEPVEAVVQRILTAQPTAVGFCCYIWNIGRVYETIALLKEKLSDVTIIVGGPEVGYRAQNVLEENPFIDYVITGEGEYALPALLQHLEQETIPAVAGVSYRSEDGVVSVPEQSLENPPSPYIGEYFENLKGRIAYLETSRGCPYSCAYCLSARCGKLKFYPIERAKEEIIKLANSGTKTVKFVDRTFNAHRERAKELFSFIIKEIGDRIPVDVCFHFEIAGDLLDEETIEILSTAPKGSMQLEVGIQSFHEPTLEYIRRKIQVEKVIEKIQKVLAVGNIHIHIDLIAGLPLETYELFRESVNKAYSVGANMLQMGFLKLLHGSPMRDDPVRYPCTFNSLAPYEVVETPWITKEELQRLHKAEWALDKLYNSGRFFRSLKYALEITGITPFDFLLAFGEWVSLPSGASLSQVAQQFYTFCSQQKGIEQPLLRNAMVCDWLSSVKGGKLPAFLQVQDERLGKFRKWLRKSEIHAPKTGIERGVALLYEPLRGVYVDYEICDPVTGQYALQIVDLNSLL